MYLVKEDLIKICKVQVNRNSVFFSKVHDKSIWHGFPFVLVPKGFPHKLLLETAGDGHHHLQSPNGENNIETSLLQ